MDWVEIAYTVINETVCYHADGQHEWLLSLSVYVCVSYSCQLVWMGGGLRFSNNNQIIPSNHWILILLEMPIPSHEYMGCYGNCTRCNLLYATFYMMWNMEIDCFMRVPMIPWFVDFDGTMCLSVYLGSAAQKMVKRRPWSDAEKKNSLSATWKLHNLIESPGERQMHRVHRCRASTSEQTLERH